MDSCFPCNIHANVGVTQAHAPRLWYSTAVDSTLFIKLCLQMKKSLLSLHAYIISSVLSVAWILPTQEARGDQEET